MAPPSTLVATFTERASLLGAAIHPVQNEAEAFELVPAERASTRTRANARTLLRDKGTAGGDVMTSGRFGIAETGSVAIVETQQDRALCLLAERLWVLLDASEIVPSLDEALERVQSMVVEGAPYVTLMSGPSRSADIERVLTIGVHGPRELHILLLDEALP